MHRRSGEKTSASKRFEPTRGAIAGHTARARGSNRTLTLALVACAACMATRAEAQGYQLTVATQPFDSIAATGTELVFTNWDDGTAALQPGFEFPFFGDPVGAAETLYASTNGLLTIGAPSDDYDNTAIPTPGAPGALIAPFWDDLQVVGGGTGRVFWQVLGAPGTRELVVEWETLSSVRAAIESLTFQARIHEDGTIELAYGLRAPGNTWSASIGLEDANGANGAALPCTATRACAPSHVPENTRLVFTPDTLPPPPPGDADLVVTVETTLPRAVVPGDQLSVDVEVVNTGDADAGPSAVGLYLGRGPRPTTSDTRLVWTALPALPSGDRAIATLSFEVPHDAAGTYTLAAIVDPFDAVDERDEANDAIVGTLDVTPPPDTIVVTTTALPDATTGEPYRAELAQVGALAPRWTVTDGALPEGLTLDEATGALTGTPSTPGLYTFVVEASEAGRTTGAAELGLVVRDASEPPPPGSTVRITSPSTLQAYVGRSTTLVLLAEGGAPPYTWSILAGALPPGLTLDAASGHVTGTPSMLGTSALTVSVTDSGGAAAQASLTLEVAPARSPSPPSGGPRGPDRGGCVCVTAGGAGASSTFGLLALVLLAIARRTAR